MTNDELPLIQRALGDLFPGWGIDVALTRGRLSITATRPDGRRTVVASPQTMDAGALSMPEWLHRATTALRSCG